MRRQEGVEKRRCASDRGAAAGISGAAAPGKSLQKRFQLGPEFRDGAVVSQLDVGAIPNCSQLLAPTGLALPLAALQFSELFEGRRVPGTPALSKSRETNLRVGIDPQKVKGLGPRCERFHFGGVANRIDGVVATRRAALQGSTGERRLSLFFADLPPQGDHPLARLLQALAPEFIAQHIGKREPLESPLGEVSHDFALARCIPARHSQDHGERLPPSPVWVKAGKIARPEWLWHVGAMHVLVTGASGFVGTRLVPQLRDHGHSVTAHDLDVDITDVDAVDRTLEAARPDAIIHLAALSSVQASWDDPLGCYRVNYLGTRNLIESIGRTCPRARLLSISSGELYGSRPPDADPCRETDLLHPVSPYAQTKAAAEFLASSAAQSGADIVRVRAFNHTGAGQTDRFVASSFARQIAEIEAGLQAPRMRVGNLQSIRDFLDVDDVIRAYIALLQPSVPADIYNVASGRGLSIEDLLGMLLDASNCRDRIEIEVDPERVRPTDCLFGDASRLQRATGWAPETKLEATLAGLLDAWRQGIA